MRRPTKMEVESLLRGTAACIKELVQVRDAQSELIDYLSKTTDKEGSPTLTRLRDKVATANAISLRETQARYDRL